jgi:hypothetical protein
MENKLGRHTLRMEQKHVHKILVGKFRREETTCISDTILKRVLKKYDKAMLDQYDSTKYEVK